MKIKFITGFAILLFAVASAFAAETVDSTKKIDEVPQWRLTPVVGMSLTTTTLTSASALSYQQENGGQSMGAGYVFGALVGFLPASGWEVESGLIYTHQRINESFNDIADNFVGEIYGTFNYLQVPVVVRYSFLPFLSAGGGVYYGHGIGSISVGSETAALDLVSGSSTFENSQLRRNDFGLVFNARGSFPIIPGINALLDARYLLGLVNLNTDGNSDDNVYLREIQLLAGVSFDL